MSLISEYCQGHNTAPEELLPLLLMRQREALIDQSYEDIWRNEDNLKDWFVRNFSTWFEIYPEVPGIGFVDREKENVRIDFVLKAKRELLSQGFTDQYIGVEVKYVNPVGGKGFFLFLYREAVERPWVAVAVFPTRTMEPPLVHAFTALEPAGLLRRVYLEDLLQRDAMRGASLGLRLLRLVVLDTGDLPAAARELADDARAEPDPLPLLDLIETILVYKLPTLSRDEIKAMLHLPDTDLKQTRFYQEVFAEGREEGLDEGRDEGRDEARRQTALNLLRQTSLDDSAIAAATDLDADAVRALRQASAAD
jgi:hypothetical protein